MTSFRTIAVAAILTGVLATSSLAQEAAGKAVGKVANVDAIAGTITLDNGQTYMLPTLDTLKTLKVGDRVSIDFTTDTKGLLLVTAIAVAA